MSLNQFLRDEVEAYDNELTPAEIRQVITGLEFYISEYLAEQIPEQIANIKEERNND